ncbi:MAG: glycosyltransferase family 4 protein [Chitinispirillaceae bacterium]|nr:glycosyltransferase family 4 protein [Chitinispirillaceae bacterium]
MTRMRVTHIVYSFLPVTQNWIYTQLRCNTLCDHAVISLTEENLPQFPWKPRCTAFAPRSPVNLLRLLLARYWIVQPDRFFQSSIAKTRPDVLHGHFAHESWRILAHARGARLPLVTTFYGLDVDKLARRRFWKKRFRLLFSYGSCFMVEGPFMGKRLHAIGCPEEKIRIVSIGVDDALYCQPPRHASSGGSDESVRVLFTGLSREKKGPVDAAAVFCKAAKTDRRLTLHCVGDGRYRPAVRRLLHRAGLLHRVTLHGYLPFEQYRELLASCDIVLAPSCYAADGDCEGGAPVVCIEAQVAGKPVVGTRHCDIPHVVVHGETGLLSGEHDTDAMARDLLLLTDSAEMRRRMGKAGMIHAVQQHAISRQVEKVTAIYRSAAGAMIDGTAAHD